MKVRKKFGKTNARPVYEFGPFFVDERDRVIRRNGEGVEVTPKVFDILLVLVQNAGRILTKDEMMKLVWPDTAVEESNLSRNISTLRKALGEKPDEAQYIETIPWRGYRFIASVKVSAEESEDVDSLIVAPFVLENADPSAEYLAEGLTDGLIDAMSLIPGLRVMSRNSVLRYRGHDFDAQRIGMELGVRAVLMGRIRQFDDHLVFSVELVDVLDGLGTRFSWPTWEGMPRRSSRLNEPGNWTHCHS